MISIHGVSTPATAAATVLTIDAAVSASITWESPSSDSRFSGSQATHGEGTQNLLCAYLAAAAFLGLAGNALFGWWWLDPIAALVIAPVALSVSAPWALVEPTRKRPSASTRRNIKDGAGGLSLCMERSSQASRGSR